MKNPLFLKCALLAPCSGSGLLAGDGQRGDCAARS
jgi:hypothetical protein